jgi:hypothetical protein
MKIMTHGGITNIVRGIDLALGFESGENWSADQMRRQARANQRYRRAFLDRSILPLY